MDCLFCAIAEGRIPSTAIYRDELTMAFLDISPAAPGHALVIPTAHVGQLHEADGQTLAALAATVAKVAAAIGEIVRPDGYNVFSNNGTAAGQVVGHLHFHVLPRFDGDAVRFHLGQRNEEAARLAEMGRRIASAIDARG